MRIERAAAAAIFSITMLAGSASAQEVINPSWASVPDGQAMADAYPEFAAMASLAGAVDLGCRVAPDGTLSLCRVNSAVPAGLGFDRAALSLTPRFRANPRQVDGEPTKSSIRFTVRFRPAPNEAGPPWKGAEPSPEQIAAAAAVLEEMEASVGLGIDLETLDLQVDADIENRLRAMVLQVDQEMREQEKQAAALALARLLTAEQLADIQAGRSFPSRPPDALLESAEDVVRRVSDKADERLRQLYCAEFECLERPATPVI